MSDDAGRCTCTGPGYCERFKIEQQQYPWEVCQGRHGEEKGRRYRRKWAAELTATPNTTRKVFNAAAAVGRVAVRAATGRPYKAPPEVSAARLAVCQANTCGHYDAAGDECRKCGCGMQRHLTLGIISRPGKTELAGERCPVGLWGTYDG